MLNDPLANVLSNVLNAEKVRNETCVSSPVSKVIKQVLSIMKDHKYLGDVQYTEGTNGGQLTLNLIGAINQCGVVKPRFAVKKDGYEKFEKRYLPAKDFGILIISTSQGMMTHIEAKQKGLGGRLISYVY